MYPKPFLCPSGHVLGEINTTIRKPGIRIRNLSLYRQADQPGDVVAVLTGPANEITCSLCGCTRHWFIGEEAIQELLEARGIDKPK